MESLFIYGAGGHGRVILDTLNHGKTCYRVATLVDDDPTLHGETRLGQVIRDPASIHGERGFVAIGDNDARLRISDRYRGRLVSVVHETAYLAEEVALGEGSVLMAATVVAIGSRIGAGVIINTGSTIDHDCRIGDGAHVAPGCHLCGQVDVGTGAFLGVGTLVVPGVRIGRHAFISAGQIVTRDVPDGARIRLNQGGPSENAPAGSAPDRRLFHPAAAPPHAGAFPHPPSPD